MAWMSLPHGWSLLFCLVFFIGLLHAEVVHSTAAPERLFPTEARLLRRLAARLSVSRWDFSAGGVECDCSFSNRTVCHVTQIFLKGQNFTGELPPDFADFPYLVQLDLSRNLFHGEVPYQWDRMKLQGLSVEGNEFHGPIPPEIGHLFHMEKLILSTNEFTGPLPAALSLLTNLTDLRVSGNNLSGRLPNFWGKLPKLAKLQMEGSLLEGPIPSSLSELTNLYDLRISDLRGSGSVFPNLSGMHSMKTMILRNCSINGSIPSYIGTLANLKHLIQKCESKMPLYE